MPGTSARSQLKMKVGDISRFGASHGFLPGQPGLALNRLIRKLSRYKGRELFQPVADFIILRIDRQQAQRTASAKDLNTPHYEIC